MAFSHGKDAVFKIEDASTTSRDISGNLTSIDFPRDADTVETSVFGTTSKSYVAGLKDATISIEGIWDSTVDGYLEGILALNKDFEYYPNTTAAGGIQYTGSCIETGYNPPSAIDAANTFTADFQVTGTITRSTL